MKDVYTHALIRGDRGGSGADYPSGKKLNKVQEMEAGTQVFTLFFFSSHLFNVDQLCFQFRHVQICLLRSSRRVVSGQRKSSRGS